MQGREGFGTGNDTTNAGHFSANNDRTIFTIKEERGNIMTQDPLMIYKLIILYMLNKVTFPLTTAQIGDFLLGREYTGFLNLQQTISELTDAHLVSAKPAGNRTHLVLTEEGRETLHFFENRISESIKEDIQFYFKENELEMKNEVAIQSSYYRSTTGDYKVELIAREKGSDLVTITLSVPLEEMASAICDNWQKKNQKIYKYLTEELF